jgi:dihydrodipicolinate synthase/N-acetylneuraminate lyase
LKEFKMKNGHKYHGAVVPMVTPFTPQGDLDGAALDRLVDVLLHANVEGIFVLGTTGEGAHVPPAFRQQLVERTVQRVKKRIKIFAGLGDIRDADVAEANRFLRAGVDAVVAHPPISKKVPAAKLHEWFTALLNALEGPLLIYNMPPTTGISIPLDTVEKLLGHPKLAGIKDSENDPKRLEELMRRFGGMKNFAVFVGVGALMEKGLKLGADGIVPSVGNLIPEICHQLCEAAQNSDWIQAEKLYLQMSQVAAVYQKGRTLNESLAALKAAVHCRGLCAPDVLPPLHSLPQAEVEKIRSQMVQLHLVN